MNRNTKRVALVTGATGAIGRAIARGLAGHLNTELVLACRDDVRAEALVKAIRQETGNQLVRHEQVDLSSQASIEALAERWRGPLHILVNNAAVAPRQREETAEGLERQFAVNVLGYLRLTLALTEPLRRSAPARVINVASYWAGDLDLDDLEFNQRRYDNGRAYRQSKQANRMLTVALAQQFTPDRISVNACHPGDVDSVLSNALGFGGHETPEQGAATPLWLALDPVGVETTGGYFEHQQKRDCRFGKDRAAVQALYERCIDYC